MTSVVVGFFVGLTYLGDRGTMRPGRQLLLVLGDWGHTYAIDFWPEVSQALVDSGRKGRAQLAAGLTAG